MGCDVAFGGCFALAFGGCCGFGGGGWEEGLVGCGGFPAGFVGGWEEGFGGCCGVTAALGGGCEEGFGACGGFAETVGGGCEDGFWAQVSLEHISAQWKQYFLDSPSLTQQHRTSALCIVLLHPPQLFL